jgi:hypothetical protein
MRHRAEVRLQSADRIVQLLGDRAGHSGDDLNRCLDVCNVAGGPEDALCARRRFDTPGGRHKLHSSYTLSNVSRTRLQNDRRIPCESELQTVDLESQSAEASSNVLRACWALLPATVPSYCSA